MALSSEYIAFLKDQMAGFGPVSIRRMFGGAGVALDGLTFAIIADETLYLKADALSASDFEAEGLENFSYEGKGAKQITMNYRRAPSRVMDDAAEMTLWCRKAYEAALRSNKPKMRTEQSQTRRSGGRR